MATREELHVGLVPNDGKGDTLRDAAGKIENNFEILFSEKKVEIRGPSGTLAEVGMSILESSTTSLLNGTDKGAKKEVLNLSGTSTVTGTFPGGDTILTMSGPSACTLVWSGTAWMLMSDANISIN